MNQIVQQVLIQMGAYIFVFVVSFFLLNKLLGGLLTAWLKVRRKQNIKVLTVVRTLVGSYFRAADLTDGFLVFKDKDKRMRRLAIVKGAIYRSMGVNVTEVDDEKNALIGPNFEAISGYDAIKNEDLHTRALMRPSLIDELLKKLLIGVIIIVALMFILQIADTVFQYNDAKNGRLNEEKIYQLCYEVKEAIIPSEKPTSPSPSGNVASGGV